MTTAPSLEGCTRAWEIEAMRDGRLRGGDVESLRRHLKTCGACAAEQASIDSLGRDLRELPAPLLDAVAGRRIRQRLLTDHNRWTLSQDAPRGRWRRPLALLVACTLLLIGGIGFRRISNVPVAGVPRERGPAIEVLKADGARWRRESSPEGARIVLEAGELRLKIQRWRATDRVIIDLPDGTLEDLGTVLSITVSDRQTREVRVEQGSVVLRLRDEPQRTLSAGQNWRREPAREPRADNLPASPVMSPPDSQEQNVARHREHREHREHARTGAPVQQPDHDVTTEPEQQRPSAAQTQASKAEDEAYLRLVDLLRGGRLREARRAAREYLLRFPNGFRRLEVLDIATHAEP